MASRNRTELTARVPAVARTNSAPQISPRGPWGSSLARTSSVRRRDSTVKKEAPSKDEAVARGAAELAPAIEMLASLVTGATDFVQARALQSEVDERVAAVAEREKAVTCREEAVAMREQAAAAREAALYSREGEDERLRAAVRVEDARRAELRDRVLSLERQLEEHDREERERGQARGAGGGATGGATDPGVTTVDAKPRVPAAPPPLSVLAAEVEAMQQAAMRLSFTRGSGGSPGA